MQPQVSILVNDRPIKEYAHNGLTFVEAKDGFEYSIRIKNNSPQRISAVCSVDGLNVIDGNKADQNGAAYVIAGFATYTIKGFRTSNDVVNAFKFALKDKSYAAKSDVTGGDTSNCGIIAVSFLAEKVNWPTVWHSDNTFQPKNPGAPWIQPLNPTAYPVWGTLGNNSFRSKGSSCGNAMSLESSLAPTYSSHVDFDAGTEFTDKQVVDKVSTTEFEKGMSLGTVEIFYAFRQTLEAMGVRIDKAPSINLPNAWPGSFCKPPKPPKQ
jgi:hypothetical protein